MRRAVIAVGGIALSVAASYVLALRPRQLRWGATDREVTRRLEGDDLIANPSLVATRAITIHAPATAVWPWIAQLGQGRGGFYSYDALENLVGCDIRSADRIVPEWQGLSVGDEVKLAPTIGLRAVAVEPPHALVLRGGVPMGTAAPPYDFTWAFVLNPEADGTTRLVVRERYGYALSWSALLVEPVEIVSFIMSQRMLRGIRQRAERDKGPLYGQSSSPDPRPAVTYM